MLDDAANQQPGHKKTSVVPYPWYMPISRGPNRDSSISTGLEVDADILHIILADTAQTFVCDSSFIWIRRLLHCKLIE